MLIWLPPSEGKANPVDGQPLSLASLSFPELTDARTSVIRALRNLGAGHEAAHVLGLGKKSAADADLNLAIETSPCAAALDLYSGVLFDHLGAANLTYRAKELLHETVWISSALFGIVRPSDMIPNHRLAMGVSLPPLGRLATWWRAKIAAVVPDLRGETIVDCRSGAYRAAYPAVEAHCVEFTVVEERTEGRKIITHMAKKWRGIAVRHLVRDPSLSRLSGYDDVIGSIMRLAESPEILDVEVSDTLVTLVTRSTESS